MNHHARHNLCGKQRHPRRNHAENDFRGFIGDLLDATWAWGCGELRFAILANGIVGPCVQAAIAANPGFECKSSGEGHRVSLGRRKTCRLGNVGLQARRENDAGNSGSVWPERLSGETQTATSTRQSLSSHPSPRSDVASHNFSSAVPLGVRRYRRRRRKLAVSFTVPRSSCGFQAPQCWINRARATAVVAHRRLGKNLSQVVTRAGTSAAPAPAAHNPERRSRLVS